MITNEYNLPQSIVRAIINDPYPDIPKDAGPSVTTLIAPAYQRKLQREHRDEIVEDAIDRLWALYGQTVHSVIERGASDGDIAERRFYGAAGGYKFHGQADLIEKGRSRHYEWLTDFKFTSVYSAKDALQNGPKPEWEQQINMLHYLATYNGLTVENGRILVLCKDWRPSEAKRDDNYPGRVVSIPVKIWTQEEQEDYITEQCRQFFSDNPPVCTMEERWYRPGKVAVMKKGRKSALRLLDTVEEAEDWASSNGTPVGGQVYLEERPGAYPRCQDYCTAAPFCPEWKKVQGDE